MNHINCDEQHRWLFCATPPVVCHTWLKQIWKEIHWKLLGLPEVSWVLKIDSCFKYSIEQKFKFKEFKISPQYPENQTFNFLIKHFFFGGGLKLPDKSCWEQPCMILLLPCCQVAFFQHHQCVTSHEIGSESWMGQI